MGWSMSVFHFPVATSSKPDLGFGLRFRTGGRFGSSAPLRLQGVRASATMRVCVKVRSSNMLVSFG